MYNDIALSFFCFAHSWFWSFPNMFFLYCWRSLLFTLAHYLTAGAKELLQSISEKQGRKMNSVESAEDIPKFVDSFKA